MPIQPSNPEPAHHDVDSMLSRKFGKEVANYFSGSPLNRVGFLRGDHTFLSQAMKHASTSFLLCNELQPLVQPHTPPGQGRLQYVKYEDVKPITGEDPFALTQADMIERYDSQTYIPQMIFLGIEEKATGGLAYRGRNLYTGAPCFAVDVTPRGHVKEASETLIQRLKSEHGYEFGTGRMMDLDPSDAAIYAEARQLLDWNARNPYCAACGHKTLSVDAGFKRTCPPTDHAAAAAAAAEGGRHAGRVGRERPPCVTRTGVSNLCFPRTDPTVIMAVVSSDGTKMLLGRQTRWPPHWYSTLAGFAEPAESIEEAVRREVYEEAGVRVGRVVIHSTQPWPYPANLMVGAIGQAIPTGERIDLGHDPELHDAQWFSLDEVRHALRVGTSALGEDAGPEYEAGSLRLPPTTAIANQLMTAVANGFASGDSKM